MALKIRNVLLLVVVLVLLYGTLGCKIAEKAGVPLPDALSQEDTQSYLEGRNYTAFPEVSTESVSSGTFQDDFEQYVADMVPFRDEALLGNAALQRQGISSAATLFGYDVYPTFLDSGYVYSASRDRLYVAPASQSDEEAEAYQALADKLNDFAAKNDDKRVFLCRTSRSEDLNRDDLSGLVAEPVDKAYFAEECLSKLTDGVTVVDQGVESLDDFDHLYYRTDHHWNIDGAYDCYTRIATAMGYGDSLTQKRESITYDEPIFYGSSARSGLKLDEQSDRMSDYVFDLPAFTVSIGDDDKKLSTQVVVHTDLYDKGAWNESLYTNRYAEYFHGDLQLKLQTKKQRTGKTLLIVGDSMSNCMERLFLSHYDTVYVYDPRHADKTIDEFVAEHEGIDDVLFLLSSPTIKSGLN